MTQTATPTLSGLLDQFILVGGPEIYGPGGLAILMALWQRAGKLGWRSSFRMKGEELMQHTGIKSRATLIKHRKNLVQGNWFKYTEPPNGSSNAHYELNFSIFGFAPVQDLNDISLKAVQKLNESIEEAVKSEQLPVQNLNTTVPNEEIAVQNLNSPVPTMQNAVQKLNASQDEPVQELNDFMQPVQNLNSFSLKNAETCSKIELLLNTITTNNTINNNLVVQKLNRSQSAQVIIDLLVAYATLHNKPLDHVRDKELELMVSLVYQAAIPVAFIERIMQETFRKYSVNTAITSFCYYEGAIRDSWKKESGKPLAISGNGERTDQESQIEKLKRMAEEATKKHDQGRVSNSIFSYS